MDSEIDFDCSPFFRLYKNGKLERLSDETKIPPSLEPQNGVVSKDVVYSPHKNLSLRIFVHQKTLDSNKKLPILIYFHCGCFIFETGFTSTYHTFLTSAISNGGADFIAVSVDYRRAPEHPIPIPYIDSWDAIKWIFTHIDGSGPEDWLNEYADFTKVFLAGDSAGANISHHMAVRSEKEIFEISGIILIHPYFWSKLPIDEEETEDLTVRKWYEKLWEIASPNSENGVDDPWFNVVGSNLSDLSGLGCERVLVMVAGNDLLVRQGLGYAAKLKRSGWEGRVDVVESEDEEHIFHLRNPDSDNARLFLQRFTEFIKDDTS